MAVAKQESPVACDEAKPGEATGMTRDYSSSSKARQDSQPGGANSGTKSRDDTKVHVSQDSANVEVPAKGDEIPDARCSISEQRQSEKKGLPLTALKNLLAEQLEEVPWTVEGLLPSGGASILAAKPKVGKSTTARALALAVARGEPFLGRACAQGPVIYVALEDKRGEVRDHFSVMGASDEPIHLHIGAVPSDPNKVLAEWIEEHDPVLVIIDTLLRFVFVMDANDYAVVNRALTPLLTLVRASGCHILAYTMRRRRSVWMATTFSAARRSSQQSIPSSSWSGSAASEP